MKKLSTDSSEPEWDVVCDDDAYCDYDAYIITILLVIVTCDDETGTISHTPVNCYNDNSCTIDSCDEQTGNCVHETIDCDDNDACTVDSCCTESGCNNATVTCNDLPCHTTSWDTKNGYEYTPVVCDDNDLLTVDSCDSDSNTCQFNHINCYDGNPCTDDFCVDDNCDTKFPNGKKMILFTQLLSPLWNHYWKTER